MEKEWMTIHARHETHEKCDATAQELSKVSTRLLVL